MPLTVGWSDMALRLALTVVAGVLLGLNRSERGRAAGLRTNLIVCLAASVSMIQVNVLLTTAGKDPDSFVMLDLMRLPLGILTGMGFIGAGAVLRKGSAIRGVTTAATLWTATVIGLCFGGGQYPLGLAALAITLAALWGLDPVEGRLKQECRAILTVSTRSDSSLQQELLAALQDVGYQVIGRAVAFTDAKPGGRKRTEQYEVRWHARKTQAGPPALLHRFAVRPDALELRWKTQGA